MKRQKNRRRLSEAEDENPQIFSDGISDLVTLNNVGNQINKN